VSWTLIATTYPIWNKITIIAEGLVAGHVFEHYPDYPAYDYADRIGGKTAFAIGPVDETPPTIGVPTREPSGDVQPNQNVTVSVNVKDAESGVENVALSFTIDDGATWENITMTLNNSTGLYEATIRGQEAGTTVRFKIIAYDVAGNVAVLDGTQPYCVYVVIPELSSTVLLYFCASTALTALLWLKDHRSKLPKQQFHF